MALVAEDDVSNFPDASGLVWSAVDVEDGDRTGESADRYLVLRDIFRVYKLRGSAAVEKSGDGEADRIVGGLDLEWEVEGIRTGVGRDRVALGEFTFPGRFATEAERVIESRRVRNWGYGIRRCGLNSIVGGRGLPFRFVHEIYSHTHYIRQRNG